jgi:hypothetical protein
MKGLLNNPRFLLVGHPAQPTQLQENGRQIDFLPPTITIGESILVL